VSAIIANLNRRDLLRQTLECVLDQDFQPLDVCVVDNGSTDGSVEMVMASFPAVKVIRNRRNLGAAHARNQGIAVTNGKYVWFLDNDVSIPSRRCLAGMVQYCDAHPNIGGVGGELIASNKGGGDAVKGFAVDKLGNAVQVDLPAGAPPVEIGYVDTLNLLARRDVVERIGGFDPGYFYLAEDKDICAKIRAAGCAIVMSDGFAVVHLRSQETRPDMERYRFLLNRNRLRFMIINASRRDLMLLPLREAGSFLRPRRVLVEGGLYWRKLAAVARAYAWILPRIPGLTLLRIGRPNFLARLSTAPHE
jgi:GT2 family glycosyltransferase